MKSAGTLKSDSLLLLAAAIWGFSFVAQRVGMQYIGPYTYNAFRFALGSISLLPLIYFQNRQKPSEATPEMRTDKLVVYGGVVAGLMLFIGSSFQQTGMVYTTAGKGGFITGLYVVLVPIMGLVIGKSTHAGTWMGAILAVIGLYLLSVTEDISIARGDLLVLCSAIFWAMHVLLIGWISPRVNAIRLAAIQFGITSFLSMLVALVLEEILFQAVFEAAVPILYGGLFSTGIAFTLQIVGQKQAHPSHAAIILSLEGAFAALGGWLLLNEVFALRGLIGCALMLAGMILSQLNLNAIFLKIFDKRYKHASL